MDYAALGYCVHIREPDVLLVMRLMHLHQAQNTACLVIGIRNKVFEKDHPFPPYSRRPYDDQYCVDEFIVLTSSELEEALISEPVLVESTVHVQLPKRKLVNKLGAKPLH